MGCAVSTSWDEIYMRKIFGGFSDSGFLGDGVGVLGVEELGPWIKNTGQ